jgi:hypothetical protein
MNKYFVRISYSCRAYGDFSGYVYANSAEEAQELIYDHENIIEQDHEETDFEDYSYSDDEAYIDFQESNVTPPPDYNVNNTSSGIVLPEYFLAEIHSI